MHEETESQVYLLVLLAAYSSIVCVFLYGIMRVYYEMREHKTLAAAATPTPTTWRAVDHPDGQVAVGMATRA